MGFNLYQGFLSLQISWNQISAFHGFLRCGESYAWSFHLVWSSPLNWITQTIIKVKVGYICKATMVLSFLLHVSLSAMLSICKCQWASSVHAGFWEACVLCPVFWKKLHRLCQGCGLPPDFYKSHSSGSTQLPSSIKSSNCYTKLWLVVFCSLWKLCSAKHEDILQAQSSKLKGGLNRDGNCQLIH